jgi:D-serine deaminase-like pyridoxal phosphate-dependent protein
MTTATTEAATAFVGQPIEAADTPALYVELDALEHNVALMARRAAAAGVAWRPHVKASKSPDLAKRLLASGAQGITCAKVGEAEAMVAGGIDDILIANEIVGPQKIARLIDVARLARLCVAVDDTRNIEELSQAVSSAGIELDVLVDINIGQNRCGVTPEAAPTLARAVLDAPGLRLRGLMGYEGHVMGIANLEEKEAVTANSADIFAAARREVEAAGIEVGIMSGGGTGNYWLNLDAGVANELQAGGGVLLDLTYQETKHVPDHRQSLFLQAQIVSTAVPGHAVADAGWKATGMHTGLPFCVAPVGVEATGLNAEHTKLRLAEGVSVTPGERITMVPSYSDSTMLLHRTLYAVRNGVIEAAWPISAAGALQ